jgi:CHAT domain-containing protein/tetratricopeptide (TPR) repeat protein
VPVLLRAGLLLAQLVVGTSTLVPGVPVERGLAGGESHAYAVAVQPGRPGQPLLVTVDQRGIDVEIDVLGPDGRSLGVVDTPTGAEGPESVLIEGDPAVQYRVEVRSPTKTAAPGRYEVRAEALPLGTPADRQRVEAERLVTEAARLLSKGTAEAARQSIALYTQALGPWRALGRHREEARSLTILAGLQAGLGDARQAIETYRQALPLWEALADPDRQAAVLSSLGLAHLALGEDKEALALWQARGDRLGEAGALNNICLLHQTQGRLDEVVACYQRAGALFHEAGETGREALTLVNLGGVYDLLGEPRQALDYYGRALALRGGLGDRRGEAQVLNNLGVTYGGLGELGEALSRYDRALAIFRELGDRQWEARTLQNLGATYLSLGELQRARAALEQALALRRATGDRRGEALTMNSLGLVLDLLGATGEALDLHRKALDLARAVGDRRWEAGSLTRLGKELLASGDPAKALEMLGQALELLKAPGDRRSRSVALQRTGEAHAQQGNLPKALEVFGEALALRRAIADRAGEAETLTAVARAEARLGKLPESRAHVEEALGLVESMRATVRNPDLRASFLGTHRQAFELDVDLLMQLDRREPGGGHAREALERSEHARARALLDLLQEARAEIRQGSDPVLREREKALTERLNAKAERQIESLGGAAPATSQAEAERSVQELLAELDAVQAEIRARSPRYAALTQPRPLGSSEIQALLDPGTLLLEYALGEERSFLWAVDAGSVTSFELPPRAEIEAAARRVYEGMRILNAGGAKARDLRDLEAASLSRMLLGPVAARLGDRRLVIVADGALHYLPFAALPEGSSGDLLIDRHEIVNLPSASVLATQRRDLAGRPPAPRTVVVFADPVFDAGDSRLAKAQLAAGPKRPAERGSGAGEFPALPRLPSTRLEAERIAALVPPDQALVELDFRAAREPVLGGGLRPFRIVHFATHGMIDAQTPALSGLVLSRVGEDGKAREGFLSLNDVYNLQLGADLVVLSGCETALGREIRGEGLVGLTQGFFYAGAARVVASLWRVQDRATAELMGRFYAAMLREGKTPAAALREAQLAVRRERRWRDPYYWSAFVLQGDWR